MTHNGNMIMSLYNFFYRIPLSPGRGGSIAFGGLNEVMNDVTL